MAAPLDPAGHNGGVAATQTPAEIRGILSKLEGKEIEQLQVLGINSLKSLSPTPDALAGQVVLVSAVDERTFTLTTTQYRVLVDLQRVGKLVWLESAEPYSLADAGTRPTVRLLLSDGAGLDLTEPSKTKRVTVTISGT